MLNKYSNEKDNSGINFLNTLYINDKENYFITFSTNGNLNIYSYNSEKKKYILYSTKCYKKKLQDAVCITILDDEYLLLLSGGYDNLINVHVIKRDLSYLCENNNENFDNVEIVYKLSLQGHVNSIRDIVALPHSMNKINKDLMFASCSQDSYIRLWHVAKITQEEIDFLVENIEKKGNTGIYEEYKTKMSYVIKTKDQNYFNIVLDSVLSGHEESVSSVRWGVIENQNVLLSSSFDFTLSLWKFDESMVCYIIFLLKKFVINYFFFSQEKLF